MSFFTSVVESTILFFHSMSGNWAFSILLLTLSIKLVLIPIQLFNFRQQRLMARVQPELDELAKTYKDDALILYRKMSEVRKREGARPGMSLLTSLMQLPIFLSIYRTFSSMPALLAGKVMWLASFAAPDPFFIFPMVVALGSYFQQRLNPALTSQANSDMGRVMKFIPILSFIFMLSLPSGLVLYYSLSGILNIVTDYGFRRWG